MLQTQKKEKQCSALRLVAAYTLLWACCAAVIWAVFRVNGKSFLWSLSGDGVAQHFISFNYLCEYLEDLFGGRPFRGFFNYNIGQGTDILQSLNSYDFTDPVSALAALFFPLGRVRRYTLMIFLKLYLTGLSFLAFCYATERRSAAAVLAGAVAYTFSGAVLFTVARHPNYANWAYFFPLLLSGAELYARKGKRAPLVLFAALNMVTSYYTFYMNTLLVGIYLLTGSVCRCLREKTATAVRKECGLLLRTALVYAVGVALSAWILLPSVDAFLNNYRVGFASGYTDSVLHYEWPYYAKLPESLFAMNYEAGWYYTELGLNAASFLPLVLLFLRKDGRTELKALLVISFLMLCLPLAGRIMNGFGYPSNRWSYAVPFYTSVVLTDLFASLPALSKKEGKICSLVFLGYLLLCTVTVFLHNNQRTRTVLLFSLGILLGVTVLLRLVLHGSRGGERKTCALLLGTVVLSGMLQCWAMFAPAAGAYVNTYLNRSEKETEFQEYSSVAVKGLSGGFFRTEEEDQEIENKENHDGYHNINGTSFYWSMYPVWVYDYYRELGLSSVSQNCRPAGLSGRTGLLELASVKYYTRPVSDAGGIPYGYREIPSPDPAYQVYENPSALPAAYTYSSYITEDIYNALDGIEKEQALLQAAVLPRAPASAGLNRAVPEQAAVTLDYAVTGTDGVLLTEDRISAAKKGTITLAVNVPEDCELYLAFRNTHLENRPDTKKSYNGSDYCVNVNALRISGQVSTEKTAWFSNRSYQWPVLRDDVLFNLGCGPAGKNTIRITFGKNAVFSTGGIELIAVPMAAYEQYAAALREHVPENIFVGSDRVTGTVSVPDTRILQFSIPYSTGWRAFMDGEETEILRSGIMYMSVIIPEGEHSFELHYETPGLKTGVVISAVTLILWVGYEVLRRRKSKAKA